MKHPKAAALPAVTVGVAALLVVAVLVTTGCAGPAAVSAPARPPEPPSSVARVSESPAATTANAVPTPALSLLSDSRIQVTIRTPHAIYRPARFTDLPGWASDDLLPAWDAFLRSCASLARREAWAGVCQRSAMVPRSAVAVRSFFEVEFAVLRVLNTDQTELGHVTGYYEPLIAGSRVRTSEYTVPVHGVPRDLLLLDWRNVPPSQRRGVQTLRLRGNELQPAGPGGAALVGTAAGAATYTLDWTRVTLDTRERRLRLRAEGTRLVPYLTRAEIAGRPSLDAPILAWVADAVALYGMQIQGAGRIRLVEGDVLRLAFAEQNGHPFQPIPIASAGPVGRTRGLLGRVSGSTSGSPSGSPSSADVESFQLADEADEPKDAKDADGDAGMAGAATRGITVRPRRDDRSVSVPSSPPALTAAAQSPSAAQSSDVRQMRERALLRDPSYVFFRTANEVPLGDGPPGAMGVSLTPGRSIAIDPRAAPLGYPMFLSAQPLQGGGAAALQRMVMAQDTGGAIRGAIRADYFWGHGREAGRSAQGTHHRGALWLLVPRDEVAQLALGTARTRGIASPGSDGVVDRDCLLPDDPLCAGAP